MKNFYQILVNTLFSTITNMTVWFAVIFFAYLQTKSVFATSLMSGLYLAAVALTGIWFGSLVDHHRKKTIMIWSNTAAFIAYAIAFIVYTRVPLSTFSQLHNPVFWGFFSLLLGGVVASMLRGIALPTVITLLVPEDTRDKANGLAGTVNGVGFLVTSVISGFLVGHSGMFWVLILGMAINALTVAHLATIRLEEKRLVHTEGEEKKSIDLRKTLHVIIAIPGLLALIFFTMFNNFLGGVFMALMDAYGLSLVSVQTWGLLWGALSCAFILGGAAIAKFGLGKNPVRTMFVANLIIWAISSVFSIYPSIIALSVGMFLYLAIAPFIQASEFTIIQKVVPKERQGRVFGFAQSLEQAASPLTAFAIGPITQFFFIPFMTDGLGAQLIGGWFGTGPNRGIALVFTLAGFLGLVLTTLAMRSQYYRLISERYLAE